MNDAPNAASAAAIPIREALETLAGTAGVLVKVEDPYAVPIPWPKAIVEAAITEDALGHLDENDELIEALATVLGTEADEQLSIPQMAQRLVLGRGHMPAVQDDGEPGLHLGLNVAAVKLLIDHVTCAADEDDVLAMLKEMREFVAHAESEEKS